MTRDYNNVHQFFPQYDSNHNYDALLFSLILIACGYTGVYRWQVTNIKHAFAFHDLVQRLDYGRKHVYMSIHCLQIAITTPERGSWGCPYIKMYPCRQPTQPRKGSPYHQSLHPRLFSNSGVGPFMSHKNQTGESAVRQDWPMVFCLTICRCHFKDSTFFSVI